MVLAPLRLTPSYAISKTAVLSVTQSLRALPAGEGMIVRGVFLGPVDTDMTRDFEIPKLSPESVAEGIFDDLKNAEEDIFPDPMSRSIADRWRNGVAKGFERPRKANSGAVAGTRNLQVSRIRASLLLVHTRQPTPSWPLLRKTALCYVCRYRGENAPGIPG